MALRFIAQNIRVIRGDLRFGLLLMAIAFIPLLCTSLSLIWLYENQWIFEFSRTKSFLAYTLLSVFLISFALIPSTVIAIFAGYFFHWIGLFSILLSYPLAVVLGLFFGRFLLRLSAVKPFADRREYSKYLSALFKHELLFVAYLRLSPILPFAMMNVLLASLPITWPRYITGSVLGMLPRTLVFFWAGMNAQEIWQYAQNPSLDGVLRFAPFMLILITLIGLYFLARQTVRESVR